MLNASNCLMNKETVRDLANKALAVIEKERLSKIEKAKLRAWERYSKNDALDLRFSLWTWFFRKIGWSKVMSLAEYSAWYWESDSSYSDRYYLSEDEYRSDDVDDLLNLISMVSISAEPMVWIGSNDCNLLEEGLEDGN